MRRVQLSLIENSNFDIAYSRAIAESSLLGDILWWTPRAILICQFLDRESHFALWICNTTICVDSIDILSGLNCIALQLPVSFPTRVPTPPIEDVGEAWN